MSLKKVSVFKKVHEVYLQQQKGKMNETSIFFSNGNFSILHTFPLIEVTLNLYFKW